MPETAKQTWVVRYLRSDSEQRKMPCSLTATVETASEGEGRALALEAFRRHVTGERLNALFMSCEMISKSSAQQ